LAKTDAARTPRAWYAEATEDWLRHRLVAAEPTC
jgi:hypothetical protein